MKKLWISCWVLILHIKADSQQFYFPQKAYADTSEMNRAIPKLAIQLIEFLNKSPQPDSKDFYEELFKCQIAAGKFGEAVNTYSALSQKIAAMVGAMNTLRLEQSANGPANAVEFGTIKDSTECMALIEMDSYLHVKKGTRYPATLITAGMNDPFVVAWQPAKFAARLQADNASNKPILLWTDYAAGHGPIGMTKTKLFETWADLSSFALWQMGHPDFQLKKAF